MKKLITALFIIPCLSSFASADTIHVPGDYSSIQEAISAALHGDTILVAPGTYAENLDFIGKSITVQSEQGPTLTKVDGGQLASVVAFTSGEGFDSVLDGFTLTNGSATYGGGVRCKPGAPTIQNNIIRNNSATRGGAVYCSNQSAARIIMNEIEENNASTAGGGVYLSHSDARIEDNVISGNTASDGGGIYCSNSEPLVRGNLIKSNIGSLQGGGLMAYRSPARIVDNVFEDNEAYQGGGAHFKEDSNAVVSNNLFKGNGRPTCRGGAIYCEIGISAHLNNNVLVRNVAEKGGGIMYHFPGAPVIRNMTLYGNSAEYGGGLYCTNMNVNHVKNCIFWNNHASVEGAELYCYTPKYLFVSNCVVQRGAPGSENIDADPCFVDPAGFDFHLTRLSPCINRGTGDEAPAKDMDGDPRPFMGSVDIGADEFTDTHPLEADDFEIFVAGGTVNFALNGGIENAGRYYLMLGGASGTAPGTPLPGGQATLPVNWDSLTDFVLTLLNTHFFTGFLGSLDVMGTATAQLNAPALPPGFANMILRFAYCVNNPFDVASNPVSVVIQP